MSVIPLRNVVLTALSTSVVDIMAAIYADMAANSTWVMTQEAQITGPSAAGDFAWTAQNPAGTIELNCLNSGTPGAPSTTTVRLGINPDGAVDPILDASNPVGSAANFSGTDNGMLITATIGNVEFLLIEFDDSLMLLFKDAGRLATPGAWYWGHTLLNPITALENSASVRLDGHCIFGPLPGIINSSWLSPSTTTVFSPTRRRIAAGNTVSSTGAGITASWAQPTLSGVGMNSENIVTGDTPYKYGPGGERVVWAAILKAIATQSSDTGYICKHLRTAPNTQTPYSTWAVGGVAQYMVVGPTAAVSGVCIPILTPFNPNP